MHDIRSLIELYENITLCRSLAMHSCSILQQFILENVSCNISGEYCIYYHKSRWTDTNDLVEISDSDLFKLNVYMYFVNGIYLHTRMIERYPHT